MKVMVTGLAGFIGARHDFTYVDDIIEGVVRVLDHPALSNPEWNGDRSDPATSSAPHRILWKLRRLQAIACLNAGD